MQTIIFLVRTIAIINQKGGVGKTTTVANLGAAIASSGHNICLIDLDPQSHLTLHFGIEPGSPNKGIYEVLTAQSDISDATIEISTHLGVVPAIIDLAAAEVELVTTVGREQILRDSLNAKPLPYEYVIIDCPPSLGLLTLNALAAADEVIIPLQPHFLALQGLGKLLETVSLVQRRINPNLKVSGVILCMYESTTRLASEVLADLRNFFESVRNTSLPWSQTKIFETVIRRNIKLAECPSYGKAIFDYAPNSHGADDYTKLAQEFLALAEQGDNQATAPSNPIENPNEASMPEVSEETAAPGSIEQEETSTENIQNQETFEQDPQPGEKQEEK